MAFSQALIASRKLPVAQRRRCVVTRAAEAEPVYTQPTTATPLAEPGKKLNEWLKTPFDLAAFGPRVTVGALLSAPERFGRLQAEVQRVTEVLNSPAPVEDKTKMLAVELETITTECLEKGATVEADVLQQLKSALPTDISASIQTPTTPVSAPAAADNLTGASTSTTPVVTELPADLRLE